jgi:hypothetical protein
LIYVQYNLNCIAFYFKIFYGMSLSSIRRQTQFIWHQARPNNMMAQSHAIMLNSHRSWRVCNSRHQNNWYLLSIMTFQSLFRQIRSHIYGFDSVLRDIYIYIYPSHVGGPNIVPSYSKIFISHKYQFGRQSFSRYNTVS